MQINYDLQTSILEAIKEFTPESLSLADELADCLSISKDSAYRRIRGETLFDIGDIEKLTKRYNLSLDNFFGIKKSSVCFNVQSINLTDFTFVDYFKSIEKNLSIITAISPKHLYYSARDVPIFHYFQDPQLSTFKLYFWLKYYLNHPALHNVAYDAKTLPKMLVEFEELAKRIWHLYLKIPSTEIWTYETVNITLRQLEFALQAKIMDQETCSDMLQRFKNLIQHINVEAEQGNKFHLGSSATLEGAEYNIFFNEVAIGDNSLLFKMGDRKMSFTTYGNLNYMSTTDTDYTNYIDGHFQSTMKNSTLISGTAEKIRSSFFGALTTKISSVESKIHSYSPLY